MSETESWKGHVGAICDRCGEHSIIACETCGFRHVVPLPSDQEIGEIYRDDYYTREKPRYLNEHEEDLDWWRLCFRERLELFERHLEAPQRRVLEIGSGPGTFLEVARWRGWEATGIEPSRAAAAYARARDLDVIESSFSDELAATLGPFDVVHLSDVLEHLLDPAAMLRRAHSVLAPEGLIAVVVPNDYNPIQRALRDYHGFRPWWVAPPHHLNYFDFDSLERLLTRCGFNVLERSCTFPIDWFLLMGENYIDQPAVGRQCHARRKQFELRMDAAGLGDLKARLYRAFAECGIGRQVFITARRSLGVCA